MIYTGNNPVTALDVKTGKILWSTKLPHTNIQNIYGFSESIKTITTPAISDQWIYISSLADNFIQYLYILDAKTGKILEQEQLSKPKNGRLYNQYYNTPAVVDGWVYVGSVDSCFYAFQGQEQ